MTGSAGRPVLRNKTDSTDAAGIPKKTDLALTRVHDAPVPTPNPVTMPRTTGGIPPLPPGEGISGGTNQMQHLHHLQHLQHYAI